MKSHGSVLMGAARLTPSLTLTRVDVENMLSDALTLPEKLNPRPPSQRPIQYRRCGRG